MYLQRTLIIIGYPKQLYQYTNGSFQGTGISPPVAQFSHFASQGVNIFRIRKFYS